MVQAQLSFMMINREHLKLGNKNVSYKSYLKTTGVWGQFIYNHISRMHLTFLPSLDNYKFPESNNIHPNPCTLFV